MKRKQSKSRNPRSKRPKLPSRTAKRTKKSKKQQKYQKLSSYLALSILALLFINILTYFWMNQKVTNYLNANKNRRGTTIYYRPYKIEADKINLKRLSNYFEKLGYHRTQELPKMPGEFQSGAAKINLFSREFYSESGKVAPQQFVLTNNSIQDQNGNQLKSIYAEPAILLSNKADQKILQFINLKKFPLQVQQAILASEDHRFYSHFGVDLIGLIRATFINLLQMRFSQGGSTITQQLVKNTLLYPKKTLLRKYLEILAAISLEQKLSKERILELYLNEVYLGQEGAVAIHGIAAASQTFFGKDLQDLSLDESALLAGIIKAPSYYSPRKHPQRATEQRNLVLAKMLAQKWITEEQYKTALTKKTRVLSAKPLSRQQNYFIEYLSKNLDEVASTQENSKKEQIIMSSLDFEMQSCANSAVSSGLQKLRETHPRLKNKSDLQAALVAVEPFSGLIRAWVGGSNYGQSQFDRVAQAQRQIGSLIKPFVYLTALDGKLNSYRAATADSVLIDDQVRMQLSNRKIWEPKNYDQKYRGQVTLRYALENSLNVPAVYLSQKIGLPSIAATLRNFGIIKEKEIFPATVLGSSETSLLTITNAYAALANGGNFIPSRTYSKIFQNEEIIAENKIFEKKVSDEAATFILTNILQGVVVRGTAKSIQNSNLKNLDLAGKTGTTNELRDAWFVGYSPKIAAGVWVGLDSNKPLGLTGGSAAVPIWTAFFECLNKQFDLDHFIAPRRVLSRLIDAQTGELAGQNCPSQNVVQEFFVAGTEPRFLCQKHHGSYQGLDSQRDQNSNSGLIDWLWN